MKEKMIKTIVIIVIALTIILGNFTITYYTYNNKHEYKLKYNGLLWVALDYWTIKKYKSLDKPKKLIIFTHNLKGKEKYKSV